MSEAETLVSVQKDIENVFGYRNGESPFRRAYEYMRENGLQKSDRKTVMELVVEHIVCRAILSYATAAKGVRS